MRWLCLCLVLFACGDDDGTDPGDGGPDAPVDTGRDVPPGCEPVDSCNGADDDCDGRTDEDAFTCGPHAACDDGECRGGAPLSAGVDTGHTCIVVAGEAFCWGLAGEESVLGDGEASHDLCASGECARVPVEVDGLSNVVGVSAGPSSCAVRADGTVACWGRGDLSPVDVAPLSNALRVDVGARHACAVLEGGRVACWGSNDRGQLGTGTLEAEDGPITVGDLDDATQVAAGGDFTCALRRDGGVACWGSNASGSLGDPTVSNDDCDCAPAPSEVSGPALVRHIAAAGTRVCVLEMDGDVFCWGDGVTTPMLEQTIADGVEVAVGADHLCVRKSDGTATCWGATAGGQQGHLDDARSERETPRDLPGVSDAEAITAAQHTCVLGATGARCFGSLVNAQLGAGWGPFPIVEPTGVTAMAAGDGHNCAIVEDEVRCWGTLDARLGDGLAFDARDFRSSPVVGLPAPTGIDVWGDDACIIDGDGDVWCWGLGFGDAAEFPMPAPAVSVTTSGAMGHTCALTATGTAYCRGSNEHGQIGDGTNTDRSDFTAVSGGLSFAGLSAGGGHTCAFESGGQIWCWGLNDDGQLGDTETLAQNAPVTNELNSAMWISAGDEHTCAVRLDTVVECWGRNRFGELGDGTLITRFDPTPVRDTETRDDLRNAVSVETGPDHTCAVMNDGTLKCWGRNDLGQLGDRTTVDASFPTNTAGLTGVTRVVVGGQHTCAEATGGAWSCWGSALGGVLGAGLGQDVALP